MYFRAQSKYYLYTWSHREGMHTSAVDSPCMRGICPTMTASFTPTLNPYDLKDKLEPSSGLLVHLPDLDYDRIWEFPKIRGPNTDPK